MDECLENKATYINIQETTNYTHYIINIFIFILHAYSISSHLLDKQNKRQTHIELETTEYCQEEHRQNLLQIQK